MVERLELTGNVHKEIVPVHVVIFLQLLGDQDVDVEIRKEGGREAEGSFMSPTTYIKPFVAQLFRIQAAGKLDPLLFIPGVRNSQRNGCMYQPLC